MKNVFTSVMLGTLFLLMSCAGPGKAVGRWIGKTKDDLYKTFGPPEKVIKNGAEGDILVYSAKINLYATPGVYLSNEGDGYTRIEHPADQTDQYTKVKMFYINPAGVIYACKTQNM